MTKRPNHTSPSDSESERHVVGRSPLVQDDGRQKSLRFDGHYLQSAMYTHAPFDLALSYTRTVMGFLLFQPVPRHILIIGLGGGSLSKYCYRYVSEAEVTTVEISENIIALRDQFAIPPDDERFRIVHADGADFVDGCSQVFDVIVLDGYTPSGLPDRLCSQNFYDRCGALLRHDGVLVANFLERDRQMGLYISRLRTTFNNQVTKARAERGGNQIVYALQHERFPDSKTLRDRARELEAQYSINFRRTAGRILSDIEMNRVR